ncbi:MAG: PsbP-related protein [Ktedonobacteraceae bacterium]
MQQNSISSFLKQVTRRLSLGICSLVLLVLLVACGGSTPSGGTNGTASTAPAGGPTPTPTPSIAMTGATATTYSITYPQTWKKTGAGDNVTFQDAPTSGNNLSIVVTPNPNGVASADKLADATVLAFGKTLTNSKVVTISATITINGVTWSQRAITGTTKVGVQNVLVKAILLVATHPASSSNTQAYEIIYGGPEFTFDLVNAVDFQPMLNSFKFTA